MTQYKCGHNPIVTLVDNNMLTISAWLIWKDSVGFDGDESQCFRCYCKKDKRQTKMANKNNWIKAKAIGMEFLKLPDKVKYADINLEGERLVKYWEFAYICENLRDELGIIKGDEYWLEKNIYFRACWLSSFDSLSNFDAGSRSVDNLSGSLRGVILARKIKQT